MKQFIKDSLRFIKKRGLGEYFFQMRRETWDFISCEYLKPYLNIETKAYLRQHDKHAKHMQHMLDLEHQTYIEDIYWTPMYE
jgi:hypothetical protein